MDLKALLMGISFALIWSSAFTAGRIAVEAAPPLTVLAFRFAIAGAIGVAIALALGQRARLSGAQWRGVLIFGVMQNAAYLGLNFVAMQSLGASVVAIIASSMPLMVALAGAVFFGERLSKPALAGLCAGVAGVALIMGARLTGGADLWSMALCLGAAVALTVATLSMRRAAGGPGGLLMVVGLQMLVGAVVTGAVAFASEPFVVNWSWRFGAAFLYLTLIPGLLATWIWFVLVARIGAVKAATFHFLNPFFGVLIARALLGEPLSLWDGLGVLVIAGGILAVQLSRARGLR